MLRSEDLDAVQKQETEKEAQLPAPLIRILETRTTLGSAHHLVLEIPDGVCTPQEFATAVSAALKEFLPRPGYGVLIDGRGPIWGYGMLVHNLHPSAWLAVHDPRLGFVVVASHTAGIEIGTIVDFRNANSKGVVIAVCGPPHSGKSVFLAELYRQILLRRPVGFCFLQRAAPDGEGMWSAESTLEVVRELRQKGKFTPEFSEFAVESISSLAHVFPLVLVDMPGRRDDIAAAILQQVSHVIILSATEGEALAWQELALSNGCELLANLTSRRVLAGDESKEIRSALDFAALPITGCLVGLERGGAKEPYATTVSALADWLIQFVRKRLRATSESG